MDLAYGDLVRTRRAILGVSQRELGDQVGVRQPFIAGIEAGLRQPSAVTRQALDAALALRPSRALAARRTQVRDAFSRAGLPEPHVFGSAAHDADGVDSDLDLVVEFTDRHDIVDLLTLEQELEELLTVPVDIVDARATGPTLTRARAEQVTL